jgi:hypothetical protein
MPSEALLPIAKSAFHYCGSLSGETSVDQFRSLKKGTAP